MNVGEIQKEIDMLYQNQLVGLANSKDVSIILQQWVAAKINQNWKRAEVFCAIKLLLEKTLPEFLEIAIWDIETAIVGHCDASCIYRFTDDPKGLENEALKRFVLNGSWKNRIRLLK